MNKHELYVPSAPLGNDDDVLDRVPLIAQSTPSYSSVATMPAVAPIGVALTEPPADAAPPGYAPGGPADDPMVDAYGAGVGPGRWPRLRAVARAVGRGALAVGRAAVRGAQWALGRRAHIRRLAWEQRLSHRQLVERYSLARVAGALGWTLASILSIAPERRLAARWYPLHGHGEPFVLRPADWNYLRSIGLRAEHLRAFFNDRTPTLDDLLTAGLTPAFLASIGASVDWLHANRALDRGVMRTVLRHSRPPPGIAAQYKPLLARDWLALGIDGAPIGARLGLQTEQDWIDHTGIHPQWLGQDGWSVPAGGV